jgi:Domain of unknown function (DUF3943)
MRIVSWTTLAFLLGTPAVTSTARAQVPASPARPNVWQASLAVAALNAAPWTYNWYVKRWAWASIGTRSWGRNLKAGFTWDNDCFLDNQLAHPFHGSLYFGSARASGYGFWGSLPYAAAGSATWELFFENVRPSINDLINTTLGGIAIGEVTYRMGSILGSPVARRDMGPQDNLRIGAGVKADRLYAILGYEHGNPFDPYITRPYDAFEFSLQMGVEPTSLVRHVGISGLLARRDLRRTEQTQLVLGLYQHYDYDDLAGLKGSSQSLSGAFLAQRRIGATTELRVAGQVETVLLGAISSDENQYFRRDYDYGPGAGTRFSSSLRLHGRDLLRLETRLIWIHSVFGARAEHLTTRSRLQGTIPLAGSLVAGGDLSLSTRRSWYGDGIAVTRHVPENRAYLMWMP